MNIWIKLGLSLTLSVYTVFTFAGPTIGTTYSIIEKDALSEIEDRASSVNWEDALSSERGSWSASKTVSIPFTQEKRTRTVIPWYTLSRSIPNPKGGILYPAGYKFNPLDHIKLPQRIIAFHSSQAEEVAPLLRPTDFLLGTGDVFESMEKLGRQVYVLSPHTADRLQIKAVPSLVRQTGNKLEIIEQPIGEEK